MATIELKHLCHRYGSDSDKRAFAIENLNLAWQEGTANALLGPSGCGKTTLLNIISGLLKPSGGSVLFNGEEVKDVPTRRRHIAQVFQFPVVYDTMTVFDNLAFPLRNRGQAESEVKTRVKEVAELLELGGIAERKAGTLNSAEKQIVSLGRGIVRRDTAAVLLDEPLTVIDPVLRLDLRRKLRVVQRELKLTMIYVTHDQHEALTFADQVTIMKDGQVLQTGSPEELFLDPQTPFVGYFIGSPGMNMMKCDVTPQGVLLAGSPACLPDAVLKRIAGLDASRPIEIGIRPEFVNTCAVERPGWNRFLLLSTEHAGACQVLTLESGSLRIKARVDEEFEQMEGTAVWVDFPPENTKVFVDERLFS